MIKKIKSALKLKTRNFIYNNKSIFKVYKLYLHLINENTDSIFPVYNLTKHKIAEHELVIYIDISWLYRYRVDTGIQRVQKIILELLIKNHGDKFLIIPTYFYKGYCYAATDYIQKYNYSKLLNVSPTNFLIKKLHSNSIFFSFDLNFFYIKSKKIAKWIKSQNQAYLIYLIHDLIPISHPQLFVENYGNNLEKTLEFVTKEFEQIICISKDVQDKYTEWSKKLSHLREKPIGLDYFHLGCDIDKYNSHYTDIENDLSVLDNKQFFLMVSSIEPRKGYAQVLSAFTNLWLAGHHECLVLVGRHGWMIDDVIQTIKEHPELNKKLFWFPKVSDFDLTTLYQNSLAFIMASIIEGFGLGVVESAKFKKPLILRDIPVFREIAGSNAYYFKGDNGSELATSLLNWLELYKLKKHPTTTDFNPITWEESCNRLVTILTEAFQKSKL